MFAVAVVALAKARAKARATTKAPAHRALVAWSAWSTSAKCEAVEQRIHEKERVAPPAPHASIEVEEAETLFAGRALI